MIILCLKPYILNTVMITTDAWLLEKFRRWRDNWGGIPGPRGVFKGGGLNPINPHPWIRPYQALPWNITLSFTVTTVVQNTNCVITRIHNEQRYSSTDTGKKEQQTYIFTTESQVSKNELVSDFFVLKLVHITK